MSAINYDLSCIRAVIFDVDGVLSPALVPLGPDGVPQRMANLQDGYAMVMAVRAGLILGIISGGDQEATRRRFELIGVQEICMGTLDKLPTLQHIMAKYGLQPEEVAYVGDDVPDVAPMQAAGLAVAPADAMPDAYMTAAHITRAKGGYGVAREILEEILRAKNVWPTTK